MCPLPQCQDMDSRPRKLETCWARTEGKEFPWLGGVGVGCKPGAEAAILPQEDSLHQRAEPTERKAGKPLPQTRLELLKRVLVSVGG